MCIRDRYMGETGVALNIDLDDNIPMHDYRENYGPDYKLHINARPTMEDMNKPDNLNKIVQTAIENLRNIEFAPGVCIHHVPKGIIDDAEFFFGIDDKMDDNKMVDERDKGGKGILISKVEKMEF
eukprot:TRINITY_DN9183_c0_g1_i3.p1 TRINITY_DN9183_c0_g1~~TRINITY_DN9183_c0_g1_i3.p1  ORF type:complete len:125 (+),score=39.90 TRINITY_DN9183_c0_g1_i3:64-438(+)